MYITNSASSGKTRHNSINNICKKPSKIPKVKTDLRNLKCMFTNQRSTMNKLDEIKWLIKDSNIDILGIAECAQLGTSHERVGDAEVRFEGFTTFRRDRSFGV